MAQKEWCEITISGHQVKIDLEDKAAIEQHSWRVIMSPHKRFRIVCSMKIGERLKTVTLGNFLMNPPPGKQVYSRRFNDGLDFRKENLIVCTMKERQRLLPKRKFTTSSKYRGVSFQKNSKKWRAAIQVDGKNINLGEYQTEELAAQAYNDAAKKYFGAQAYQNIIGEKKPARKVA